MPSTVYGLELLDNGGLGESAGIGSTSTVGPGWTSSYTPCGPNIFNAPCGASTFAFFDTTAGQVTGNHAAATPIVARSIKSMAVNVGPNTAIPIIEWPNIQLVNGQDYRFRADAAIIIAPFSVALKVDGNLIAPLASPVATSQWETTDLVFTWTGTTGPHSVGIFSNSGVAAGNDHAFDNFSLRSVTQSPDDPVGYCSCDCTPVVGSTRCLPQFGPIVNLPFTDAAPINGAITFDNGTVKRFDFDWTSIIPGLTGYITVSHVLIAPAQQARFSAVCPGANGILVGNTTRCACYNLHLSQPVQLRRLSLIDFDGPSNEHLYAVDPPYDSVSPNFIMDACASFAGNCSAPFTAPHPGRGCVYSVAANQSGFVFWNAPTVRNVQWCTIHNQLLSTAFCGIDVQVPIPPRQVVRQVCKDGSEEWVDAITGTQLTPAEVATLTECE